MPEISIIIPAFNRAHVLPRCMGSVLAQTFTDWELLVVDDASTDGTAATVESFADPRIRLLRQAENGGAARARNSGVAAASGRWIAFLDSDDHWRPRKLQVQLAALAAVARPAETLGAHAHEISDGGPPRTWPRRGPAPGEAISDYLFTANGNLQTSTWMLARDLAVRFPFQPEQRRHQDWDLLLQLGAAGIGFQWLPEPLAVFECQKSSDRLSDVVNADYSRALLKQRRALFTESAALAFEGRVIARQLYHGGKHLAAWRLLLRPSLVRAFGLAEWTKLLIWLVTPRIHAALVERRAAHG